MASISPCMNQDCLHFQCSAACWKAGRGSDEGGCLCRCHSTNHSLEEWALLPGFVASPWAFVQRSHHLKTSEEAECCGHAAIVRACTTLTSRSWHLILPVTTFLILSKHYSSPTSVSDRQEHRWRCTSLRCFQEKEDAVQCQMMLTESTRCLCLG